MKRAIALATAVPMGFGLVLAAITAPTTAASPSPTTDWSNPAAAKGPASWTKISTGDVAAINEPALYRTGDGVLHVGYTQGDRLRWSNISKHGRLTGQGTIQSGWDTLSIQPKLIATQNNGIRIVFGGINADRGFPYNAGRLYTASANSGGRNWTLAPGALTEASFNTYGIGALSMPGQGARGTGPAGVIDPRPIVAAAFNETIYWRQADGSATPTTPDNRVTPGCCVLHSALARDGNDARTYLGWYNFAGSNPTGIYVKQLLPDGPIAKAPGSVRLNPDQTVALSGRRGAPGVYAAYCVGSPSCNAVKLWRVGANRAITVPRSKNAESIALAAAPSGRLWVTWVNDTTNRVHATLTNRNATRFGVVRSVKLPQQFSYRLSAYSGAVRHLDVVINTDGELFHRQLLPGLKLTAKPRQVDNDKRHVVTFTVTDAGVALAGAKVRIAGKTDVTNANGKATITFRKGTKPGRYHAIVGKAGYAKGHVTIRVRQ